MFGYWTRRIGTFWMEGDIALQGYDKNVGNIQFLICRNGIDVKNCLAL